MKHWLSSKLPDRDSLLAKRWMRPFAHRLGHPALWHFNRWSVSRGLALGLFCGFLIPFGQVLLAALFAVTVRANLIVAAAATLVTNPFTFPAIYYAAYKFGSRLVGTEWWAIDPDAVESFVFRSLAWLLNVSAPTMLGLIVFAAGSALAGYHAVQLAWRLWIVRRWSDRRPAR